MAKKHNDTATENVAEPIEEVAYAPDEVLAHIVKDDEGNYHLVDLASGETGPSCEFCDEGDKTIVLTPNRANRKWANRKKADDAIAISGFFPLTYKASRHIEASSAKVPNAKMVEWYRDNVEGGQAIYDEYMAIVNRAIEACQNAKSKPLTEKEKLQKRLERAKASYDKLLAEAAKQNN